MLALQDGNTKRAVTLARRGRQGHTVRTWDGGAVYLLGMLATLAAEAGVADAASQWLRESEETYAGDGWDIMRSNCYWHAGRAHPQTLDSSPEHATATPSTFKVMLACVGHDAPHHQPNPHVEPHDRNFSSRSFPPSTATSGTANARAPSPYEHPAQLRAHHDPDPQATSTATTSSPLVLRQALGAVGPASSIADYGDSVVNGVDAT